MNGICDTDYEDHWDEPDPCIDHQCGFCGEEHYDSEEFERCHRTYLIRFFDERLE